MAANRMLRNWTASARIDMISAKAEAFFVRLIMVADNYGRFYADPRILKSNCYPLKEKMKSDEIIPLLKELETARIIQIYEAAGKQYFSIYDFGQRLYLNSKSTFPDPPGFDNQIVTPYVNNSPRDAALPGASPLELNRIEVELNKKDNEVPVTPVTQPKKLSLDERKQEFYNKMIPFVAEYGKEMVRAFYAYWSEANEGGKKMRLEMERTFEIKRRLVTWATNEKKFESKNNFKGNGQNDEQEKRVRASQAKTN